MVWQRLDGDIAPVSTSREECPYNHHNKRLFRSLQPVLGTLSPVKAAPSFPDSRILSDSPTPRQGFLVSRRRLLLGLSAAFHFLAAAVIPEPHLLAHEIHRLIQRENRRASSWHLAPPLPKSLNSINNLEARPQQPVEELRRALKSFRSSCTTLPPRARATPSRPSTLTPDRHCCSRRTHLSFQLCDCKRTSWPYQTPSYHYCLPESGGVHELVIELGLDQLISP